MALLKAEDIKKMSKDEITSKLSELRLELVKAQLPTSKTRAKTTEIRKAIARCLTIAKMKQEGKGKK